MDFLNFLDLMKAVDEREAKWGIGHSLGLDKETIDEFIDRWQKLHPTIEDTIPRSVLEAAAASLCGGGKSLKQQRVEMLGSHTTEVDFATFIRVMRRMSF